jgi:hypothetical protein
VANPLATILSVAMMLRYTFGNEAAAQRIEAAVKKVLAQGCAPATFTNPARRGWEPGKWATRCSRRCKSGKEKAIMKRVGLVGWRGMVGSVLMQRMREEGDFALIEPVFFTTSNVGGKAPVSAARKAPALQGREEHRRAEVAATSSSPARAATTPTKSSPSCARPAGTGTGSTPPRAAHEGRRGDHPRPGQ